MPLRDSFIKSRRSKTLFPIATALRVGLKNYNADTFKRDLTAGLVVSLVALPLSMALAIAVGLPPQHGLYTAIVAGIVSALLGGSMVQVSGPTAAFVVIIAPLVAKLGLHGIIWCQIMAGIMLIALGTSKMGKLITYVPYPVTMGFTAGIGVVIGTLSLNDFLGLGVTDLKGDYFEKVATLAQHLPGMKWQEFVIGAVTLFTIIYFRKITAKIPAPIVGIALGTILALIFDKSGLPVSTLQTQFTYETAEGIRHGIPPYPPIFHLPTTVPDQLFSIPSYMEFKKLFVPAMAIAVLAALESLLAATVADSIAGTRHEPNAELNGIGIANIITGLASGIPATGAIARTATNINAGAKTPIASIVHALLILLYVLTLAPLINYVPMAALSALLLNVAAHMANTKQFINTCRIAPKSDVVVLLGCFLVTVAVDMVAGIAVGMTLACLLFIKNISESANSHVTSAHAFSDRRRKERKLPANAMIYHIEGPLFFGTVEKTLEQIDFVNANVKKLIIDMTRVPLIDMTGVAAMKEFLRTVSHDGREIVLCGKKQVTRRIMQKLSRSEAKNIHTENSVHEALEEYQV